MEMIKEKDIEIEEVAHCHRGGNKDKNGKDEENKGDKENKKEPVDGNTPVLPEESIDGEVPVKPENEGKPENKPDITPEAKPESKPVPGEDDLTKPSDKDEMGETENSDENAVPTKPTKPDGNAPQNNGTQNENQHGHKGDRPDTEAVPPVAEEDSNGTEQ